MKTRLRSGKARGFRRQAASSVVSMAKYRFCSTSKAHAAMAAGLSTMSWKLFAAKTSAKSKRTGVGGYNRVIAYSNLRSKQMGKKGENF